MRISKSVLYIFVFSLLLSSCDEKEFNFVDILTIRIPIEIPAGLNPLETHYFEYIDVASRLDAVLQANNLTYDSIEFIQPRFAQLISNSIGNEFSFLSQATVEIGNIDRPFIPSFFVDRIPENEDSILDVIPNEVDLKTRFRNARFNTRLKLRLKRVNVATFAAELEMSFFII